MSQHQRSVQCSIVDALKTLILVLPLVVYNLDSNTPKHPSP